ncbi:MAG: hypothetical protein IJC02_01495 [Lachnospiraceae bacterium]|nr:hypothetical protein [Lachnospiraceae bacterium]MBQ6994257.1 hypothetical protein [Lachnospiraceae bacterium]
MNRFRNHATISLNLVWKFFSILLVISFLFFFFQGVHAVDHSTTEEQAKSLEQAIRRSVIQCYSVEGTYPPSLDYLKKHYGVFYDSDLFYVDYTAIGSNIMPDITIIPTKSLN